MLESREWEMRNAPLQTSSFASPTSSLQGIIQASLPSALAASVSSSPYKQGDSFEELGMGVLCDPFRVVR